MILSNLEIQKAIDQKRIILIPEPLPRSAEENQKSPYDTTAVDLCLGPNISVPLSGSYSYDLDSPGEMGLADFIGRNSRKYVITDAGYPLKQNQFILGMTKEYLNLPLVPDENGNCLAARVEGKSSRARCGLLVHFTAPTIHAGFEGHITLEIINLGPAPFVLRPDLAIAQLIFEEVKGLPQERQSQFHGQKTPEGQ